MTVLGADVDQLRVLARMFGDAADRLNGAQRDATARLQSADWKGLDAERFRSQWHGESTGLLRTVEFALRSAKADIERNATEQEHASQSSGRSSSGPHPGGGTSTSVDAQGNPVVGTLGAALGVGAFADDVASLVDKDVKGVAGDVLSGAGVVTSLVTMTEGYANGDNLQVADGMIGLGGEALGRANPVLGIAAAAAQGYGALTLPTSNEDIDGVFDMGAHNMFGTSQANLTDEQTSALNHRYDGAWGVANMISDSMDSKAAKAGKFFSGLFGR